MNSLIKNSLKFTTLVELLQYRAGNLSGFAKKSAFTYLNDGENISGSLDYEQLDKKARNVAAHLQEVTNRGDRVLLVYPPSLDYIVSFLGCVYAGVIAVPAVPPANIRTRPRLLAIAKDASPSMALGPTATVERMKSLENNSNDILSQLKWLATDNLEDACEKWIDPKVKAEDIVFLQYTSGSTGTPKGVMVSHKNLLSNVALSKEVYDINDEDVFVSWLPPHHDFGLIGGIVFPLYVGCHCVQFPPAIFFSKPYRWLKILSNYGAKMTGAPNFAYELCVKKITEEQKSSLDLSSLEVTVNGAERIRCETLQRFSVAFENCGFKAESFTPAYGLAESTLFVAAETKRIKGELPKVINFHKGALSVNSIIQVYDDSDSISLVSNGPASYGQHHIKIVDPQTMLQLEQGEVGEILVHSPSVAKGYWNRPEESMRTFEVKVIGDIKPYLRTGDLGFIYKDSLFIAGRIKELMIFNGKNFYPQDIESTIESLDPAFRVNGCAVFALEKDVETQLVIVQEIESRKMAKTESLVSLIRSELAEKHELYSLHAIVLVKTGQLPRTSSGKIQRVLCSELYTSNLFSNLWVWKNEDFTSFTREKKYFAPVDNVEQIICDIWQEVLLMGEIGRYDNFFELGGHSLLATQVLTRLRTAFNIDIPLRTLFESPSLHDLAQRIEALQQDCFSVTLPIERADRLQALPLSFAQQRLWFLDQLENSSALYNIPAVVQLTGKLSLKALRAAFNIIIRRHEALRTTFPATGNTPLQTIAAHVDLAIPVVDLSDLPLAERQLQVSLQAQNESQQPFDLATGPLIRARILRLAHDSHIVLLTLHHIVSDGWSMGVLIKELAALYTAYLEGKPASLPELTIQYADYAQWQRQLLNGKELQRQSDYWRKQLADIPVLLNLPTDHPRPLVQRHRGASVKFIIPASSVQGLRALGQQYQGTLFMTLAAALSILLSRYAGQDDICIGTPIANRQRVEIEPLIGFFVNTLVLRSRVDHSLAFSELLEQVRNTTLEAYAHQDLPFEQIVEMLNPARHTSHAPLFQVMLAMQNTTAEALELPGLMLESIASENVMAKFDLLLNLAEVGDHLVVQLDYNIDLFEPATINRLAEHFTTLLAAIVANPAGRISNLPMLGAIELGQLREWNNTAAEYSQHCIHQQFETQAESTPENVALVFEEKQLSYGELNRRANQLAHYLRGQGVGPGALVGIFAERSLDMIIAVLGILKAGGAYLPLDPSYPSTRIAFMLEDARPVLVLTQDHLQPALAVHEASTATFCLDSQWGTLNPGHINNPIHNATPESLAYVIYTSGSTGKPKGVCIPHKSVVNLKDALLDRIYNPIGGAQGKRVGLNASISFDASVKQWLLLLAGASLYLIPEQLRTDAHRMVTAVAGWELDVLDCTPSQLPLLLDTRGGGFPRAYLIGGEAIDQQLWDRIRQHKQQRFYNVYGPTEATVDSLICDIHASGPSPILGLPIDNVQVHLLDAALNQVPVGVTGEIYIGGKGVAQGYLNQPELTAERFIPDPFSEIPGARLYRSGDLGRRMTDGKIVYLGRIDNQVKIRGFRIELGEIEAAISTLVGVKDCVVSVKETPSGDKQLVAYVIADGVHALPSGEEFRIQLLRSLPSYMVPVHFVRLEEWPLTSNGKVDRQALSDINVLNNEKDHVAPATKTETILAGIWQEVLGLEGIGRYDNFFELGGHSLLTMKVAARLRDFFYVDIPLQTLFNNPLLIALAQELDLIIERKDECSAPRIEKKNRLKKLPLSYAQERLWLLEHIERMGAAYNISGAVRFTGALEFKALEKAFEEIVKRHETLRTRFIANDDVLEQVIDVNYNISIELFDLSEHPKHQQKERINLILEDVTSRRFNLASGHLLRAYVLKLNSEENILIIVMHHIISDGWSLGILVKELGMYYAAYTKDKQLHMPALPIQYADYSIWQREMLQGDVLTRQVAYWKKKLSGMNSALELPLDRQRPSIQSYQGADVTFILSEEITAQLKLLSLEENATPFMVLTAAFKHLLSRWSGQEDITIGTPVAGRTDCRTEGLIGFFINILVLRTDVSGKVTLRELISRIKETSLEAYQHQELPFERIVEEINPVRDLSRHPIIQVMINSIMTESNIENLSEFELQAEPFSIEKVNARFDMMLRINEGKRIISCKIDYATALFDATTMKRFAEQFKLLLQKSLFEPDYPITEFDILTESEKNLILHGWNKENFYERKCMKELFSLSVKENSFKTCIEFKGKKINYTELDSWSNRIARQLKAKGIKPNFAVGLVMSETAETIATMIAIIKISAYILPMDVSYPSEYLNLLIESCGAKFIVGRFTFEIRSEYNTSVEIIDAIVNDDSGEILPPYNNCCIEGSQIAYLMPLFNEPGIDKIAAITHLELSQYLQAKQNLHSAETSLRLKFSIQDVFFSLVTGLCINLERKDGSEKNKSLKINLSKDGLNCGSHLTFDNPLEVGRPYILDRNLMPVSIGVIGDLYIEKTSNDVENIKHIGFTDKDFIKSPFNSGKRLHRTGKQAKWRTDGSINIMQPYLETEDWRDDFDYREIESVLKMVSSAKHVAVKHEYDESGEELLIAFITSDETNDENLIINALKDKLRKRLPFEKIPSAIFLLENMPLTARGFIDWDAVALYENARTNYEEPVSENEKMLALIWGEILGVDKVSLNDNFFELGGHSLLATLVIAKIRDVYDIEISLRSIFEAKTMKALAVSIENMKWAKNQSGVFKLDEQAGEEFGSI
ncbi:amino acid adenylation domain-containing protein [Pantoea allii]|nr:non-ribosomal peptide synthetase [Pantoea allii]THB85435.1 amino acid adenylation domain-containing protein [Pantoea allii]